MEVRQTDPSDPSRSARPLPGAGKQTLTPAQQREVEKLQETDRHVHMHEQAHMAAGGGLAGAATYTYRTGPDGKRYAVGGEVSIDVSPEKDPQRTIAKMQRVEAAALAPSDPSPQDMAVARNAERTKAAANQELRQQEQEKKTGSAQSTAPGQPPAEPQAGQQKAAAKSRPVSSYA